MATVASAPAWMGELIAEQMAEQAAPVSGLRWLTLDTGTAVTAVEQTPYPRFWHCHRCEVSWRSERRHPCWACRSQATVRPGPLPFTVYGPDDWVWAGWPACRPAGNTVGRAAVSDE